MQCTVCVIAVLFQSRHLCGRSRSSEERQWNEQGLRNSHKLDGAGCNKTGFVSCTGQPSLHRLTQTHMYPVLRYWADNNDSLCECMCACTVKCVTECMLKHACASLLLCDCLKCLYIWECGFASGSHICPNQNNVSQIKIRSTAPIALFPSPCLSLSPPKDSFILSLLLHHSLQLSLAISWHILLSRSSS